ncbi:DUF1576 domain-containing protein [Serpentinicella sp. ANB-PHB4]|uniref:DUF1576 domain-containing protein n=1 Tax=Serpentinicella sp. ANB-PHB4 TaxID=3074076 RepID=UPI00285A49BF|nr:DUF1576 domain-containing protein [Serpentinicella sp. ANB-PHB4]MDR5659460.1 DUF1576 domain-containing protein [Serpentinicella sp. ANB-PHB4]
MKDEKDVEVDSLSENHENDLVLESNEQQEVNEVESDNEEKEELDNQPDDQLNEQSNKEDTKESDENEVKEKLSPVKDSTKFNIMLAYSIFFMLTAFIFNSPSEIIEGLKNLTIAQSILVSDYMAIGNVGAALFNCGLLMLIATLIVKINKVEYNGPIIAAIFTIGGFALFGKNIYNIWAVLLGVLIYSKLKKETFSKFIVVALFGTALGPLISQITFGYDIPMVPAILVANGAGVLVGFALPALGAHFVKFHQGFNLYNIGFTAGMVGTLSMAILRAFGFNHDTLGIAAEGYNTVLTIYLSIIFVSMLIIGLIFNNKSFKGYKALLGRSGRAVTDFVILDGFGLSFINMGILGFITMIYILLVGGELNGPIIGGIFTIIGFGAFGKHTKNILPVLIGVFLASKLFVWDTNAMGPLLAALFGTTLAPIAGEFGWKFGMLAGFMHMAMVMNVGYLHGGMNLYNNGFSGGMVAALLIPVVEAFVRKEESL